MNHVGFRVTLVFRSRKEKVIKVTPHEEDLIVSIYALFYFVKGCYTFSMKPKSIIFVALLFVILAFILGVRYGQRVEKANKAIDYLQSLPTPTAPIISTPITYREYKSKKYGLKFTYPSNLEIKESTNSPEILLEMKK